VSTLRLHVEERRGLDPAATFRDDFLRVVSRLGLGRDHAVALVEASTGQPFASCRAPDLLPILGELRALAHRTTHVNGGPACHV
jgi:hypothetical protein